MFCNSVVNGLEVSGNTFKNSYKNSSLQSLFRFLVEDMTATDERRELHLPLYLFA